ncbi:cobyrinate a,c-diamide synthase [Arenibaculum pallidiluteum]|uniref:cobyrinate a,c-diamide synthase n=1 Tax=Arenibaculum pallidiluteum TaxID=2812559 RepID=UPI001A97A7AD|nr:cobyrinate a,c-diamide synthase [Arenibaculum pallidiluteum]
MSAPPAARGLILAAPASGSGKTVLTLALLRALRRGGQDVASCKTGPDYIDPRFHEAASGRPCPNLDPWGMRPGTLARLLTEAGRGTGLLVVEGAMGLFDGAADGTGSTADLAALTGWPVVLVVDVRGQSQSVAAVVAGFRAFRRDVDVAGVLLNRVGSPAHEAMLRAALAPLGLPVLGAVPRNAALGLPDRHLGLVQAGEHPDLGSFLDVAADIVAAAVDLGALAGLARRAGQLPIPATPLPPPGQRVALARDLAFAFAYPHLIQGWRAAGAEILPFSPLAGEGPDAMADVVFLPGGYPELHAGRLAAAGGFLEGLRVAAARGAVLHGECGGYMVLGRGLVDADGVRHAMAGLLPLETSFAERRLHLGYRSAVQRGAGPFGPAGTRLRGHEFHYARILSEGPGDALFDASDARGDALPAMGLRSGRVTGSFLHAVDLA